MWSIFGILKPGTGPEREVLGPQKIRQRPFFSLADDGDVPESESDAAALSDRAPVAARRGQPDHDHLRFVTLFAPPYF